MLFVDVKGTHREDAVAEPPLTVAGVEHPYRNDDLKRRGHFPWKRGGRFSKKARMPSW
jgi:hypothetical protein